ncbi:MAG: CHAT domain-containing protein [Bacteroidetes bacterium]|nr:CHAT domain-containing protein [Bacteroidota bacterium]
MLRKLILYFTIFILSLGAQAQNRAKLESLWRIYNNSLHDTTKVQAYIAIGDVYEYVIPDSALYFYHKALKVVEDNLQSLTNDSLITSIFLAEKATANQYIGIVLWNRGNFDLSLHHHNKALAINEKLGNKKRISSCFSNIGLVYADQGDYDKAINFYEKSVEIKVELGDRRGSSITFNNMGNVYNSQGNYEKALEYYVKSLEIKEEYSDKRGMSASYINIGIVYKNLATHLKDNIIRDEMFNKAIVSYQKALNIYLELDDKMGESTVYVNIGNVYVERALKSNNISDKSEYFKRAFYYYRKSLERKNELLDKNGEAIVYGNLASLFLNLANDREIAKVQSDMNAYLDSAIIYGERSILISREIGSKPREKYATLYMAIANWKKGRTNFAASYFDNLIQMNNNNIMMNFSFLSEFEKEKFFSTIGSEYDKFNSFALYLQKTFPELAVSSYNNTIKNKGLLLKSNTAMKNAVYNSNDSLLIKRYDEWIQLRKDIAKLYAQGKATRDLEKTADEMESFLVRNSNEFSNFKKVQDISYEDIRKKLKANEAVIEFINFQDFHPDSNIIEFKDKVIYAAILLKSDSKYPEIITLFEEKQLEELLSNYTGNNFEYINQVYGTLNHLNTSLYEIIWKPLESHLQGINKVFISPTGLLHKISFAAIAKGHNKYLCDIYNIELKSNTGILAELEDTQAVKIKNAIIYGGIEYSTEDLNIEQWKYLPGTKSESEKISKLLQSKKINNKHFTGEEASEESFKNFASDVDLLHIATHGFFYPDPEKVKKQKEKATVKGEVEFRSGQNLTRNAFVESKNPFMRSGLIFAGANYAWNESTLDIENDGILTAQEVTNIDLRKVELLVMSACETGLGDIVGSEGVYGLQRAFKMAGVKKIIMSLWQVPDKETEEFMTLFYQSLTKTNDIKLSFVNTQKAMRLKYDPFYWAAFVLIE